MTFTELEREVLEAAALGHVVDDFENVLSVAAVYRELESQGLLQAEWWGGDQLPVVVAITPAGAALM